MEFAKNFTENPCARRSMRVAAAFLVFLRSKTRDTPECAEKEENCVVAGNEAVSDVYVCAARSAVMCVLACWGFQNDVDVLLTEHDVILADACAKGAKKNDKEKALRAIIVHSREVYEECNEYLLDRDIFRVASLVAALLPFGVGWAAQEQGDDLVVAARLREPNVGFVAATVVCPEGGGKPASLDMARQIAHAVGANTEWPVLCPTTLVQSACEFCRNVTRSLRNEKGAFAFYGDHAGSLRLHDFMDWSWGAALANPFARTVSRKSPATARNVSAVRPRKQASVTSEA